jgi:hypothetical protein
MGCTGGLTLQISQAHPLFRLERARDNGVMPASICMLERGPELRT